MLCRDFESLGKGSRGPLGSIGLPSIARVAPITQGGDIAMPCVKGNCTERDMLEREHTSGFGVVVLLDQRCGVEQ